MSGSHTCSTGGSAKIAGSGGSVSVFTACATRSGRRPNASSWSTLKKEQKLPAVSRNCNVYSQPRSRKNTESPHDTMPKKRNFKTLAIGCTGFDACSGHPGHKGASVMVAAIAALREWSASKFGCPDQQGILKQASFFQVFDKRRNWLIDAACDRREFRGD